MKSLPYSVFKKSPYGESIIIESFETEIEAHEYAEKVRLSGLLGKQLVGVMAILPKVRRAKNPAPRVGTKKPMRKSQVTKSPPSKQLVKRRKKNTETGYFPNPEVHHRMSKKRPTMKIIRPEFHVRTKKDHAIIRSFSSMVEAERFAQKFADANDCILTITD